MPGFCKKNNMPIRKIQFTPGEFYHIYNRGNARQNIFCNDKDRYRFLQAMYISNSNNLICGIEQLEKDKSGYTLAEIQEIFTKNKIIPNTLVKICADCLMPNHYHFLLQETQKGGVVNFMQRLGTSYAKYFITKYDRPGSLFQGRFKAVHIKSDYQLKYLVTYINAINPAQLIEPKLKENGIKNFKKVWEKINDYKWSTHFEFIEKRDSILIDKNLIKEFYPTPKMYMDFIKDIIQEKDRKLWASIGDIAID
jgi:putative transposase